MSPDGGSTLQLWRRYIACRQTALTALVSLYCAVADVDAVTKATEPRSDAVHAGSQSA